MGNKTRKLHNTRGSSKQSRPMFQRIEPERAATPPAKLEFPFYPVDAITVAFGSGIPGYREVLAAVPPEFKRDNKWSDLANSIFFSGAKTSSWKWRSPELKPQQLAYFKAWAGSFEPKHEQKESVCGWLLSLMLEELPQS